jgi:hypothetical protein
MTDIFQNRADDMSAPASRCVAVTPSDGLALPETPKALYVGTGGSIVLQGVGGGGDVTLANVPGGCVLPIRVAFVRASGTTAADIVALL